MLILDIVKRNDEALKGTKCWEVEPGNNARDFLLKQRELCTIHTDCL